MARLLWRIRVMETRVSCLVKTPGHVLPGAQPPGAGSGVAGSPHLPDSLGLARVTAVSREIAVADVIVAGPPPPRTRHPRAVGRWRRGAGFRGWASGAFCGH